MDGIPLRRMDGTSPSLNPLPGTLLFSDAAEWVANTTYDVVLSRIGNDLIVDISDATADIDATITDKTYPGGSIGFQTYGQWASFGADITIEG